MYQIHKAMPLLSVTSFLMLGRHGAMDQYI
nr:MAG TPA: hypothetical protein [Caudoviricetes sp.]